jgi:hypothetical protein
MLRSSRAAIVPALLAASVAVAACDKNPKASTTTTAAEHPATTGSAMPKVETSAKPATTAAPAVMKPVLTFKDVGLATPESVLYDDTADLYLSSNIDGKPLDADGKGFIAKLKPDGTVETLKWIESGKNKVTLNAPKGMAFMGDHLYVADLDTVRIFDRKTGAPAGEVKVPGATFLNDVALHDGHIIVTDTGMKAAATGFEPSGTEAVYSIDKDKKLTTIAKGAELGKPNGVLSGKDKIWVVTFGTDELYSLDSKGKKGDVNKLPKGQLDGIVALPGSDDLLVSSWESSAVYRGKPGGEWKPIVEGVKAPADIGYDTKRGRLLIPRFNDNEIDVYEVR